MSGIGDHLAGVREPDQPVVTAERESQPRRLDLRRGLAGEAARELLLERA